MGAALGIEKRAERMELDCARRLLLSDGIERNEVLLRGRKCEGEVLEVRLADWLGTWSTRELACAGVEHRMICFQGEHQVPTHSGRILCSRNPSCVADFQGLDAEGGHVRAAQLR